MAGKPGPDAGVVDMSPEAVRRRLEDLAQLWELWNSLRHARILGPVSPSQQDSGSGRG